MSGCCHSQSSSLGLRASQMAKMRSMLLDGCCVSMIRSGGGDCTIDDVRVMEEEDWIECSEFIQRHVTRPVSFSSASHDVDVVVEAFERVLLVERKFFAICPELFNIGTVGHLGVAHWWSIEDPIELSSQWYCCPILLAHGISQGIVDVLMVHCAGWRKTPDRVDGHGWCLELELLSECFLGPLHIVTYHVPEHVFPREANIGVPFCSVQIKHITIQRIINRNGVDWVFRRFHHNF
jgi:hypothetical protein